jgi:hypothetical protein
VTDVELAEHVQFGLVEFDLLATFAEVEIPFPLQVPSFGEEPADRDILYATAGETLELRGLADEDGPLDLADTLVNMLANRTGAIDLVVGGQDWQSGAVALVDARDSLLCLQRFNDEERDLIEVYHVPTDSLAAELVYLVPGCRPGPAIPLRLPLRGIKAAQGVLDSAEDGSDPGDEETIERRLRAALRDGGIDATATGKLVSVLHPLECYGQMGVTRPDADRQDVRVGAELSWIDTPRGRYSISATEEGDGWVSVNPLHQDDLLGAVRGFVSTARR